MNGRDLEPLQMLVSVFEGEVARYQNNNTHYGLGLLCGAQAAVSCLQGFVIAADFVPDAESNIALTRFRGWVLDESKFGAFGNVDVNRGYCEVMQRLADRLEKIAGHC